MELVTSPENPPRTRARPARPCGKQRPTWNYHWPATGVKMSCWLSGRAAMTYMGSVASTIAGGTSEVQLFRDRDEIAQVS